MILTDSDIEFYWPHGIEMELQLVNKDGKVISGEVAINDINSMVKTAHTKLCQILESENTPESIKDKISSPPFLNSNKEKGLVVSISYKVPDLEDVAIDLIGRDGNVTISTYILELVTPPSESTQELIWWLSTLQEIIEQSLPNGFQVLSTGMNPLVNEYTRGLSFADQHHIGIADQEKRIYAYNMIRNFIPHLIGLSVNSPLIAGKPTDNVRISNNRLLAPGCVKSIRLQKNETMLSSGISTQYIPYLKSYDPDYYIEITQKASLDDAKFQDLFPFTEFQTIETRIMDAQLTIARRVGFALILQALAKKGLEFHEKKISVPDAGSIDLYHNRKAVIERGLLAPHRKSAEAIWVNEDIDLEFVKYYYGTLAKQPRYMFESVQNMFLYLETILREMDAWDSSYIQSLLSSAFWGFEDVLLAPVTGAEYQLYLYDSNNNDIQAIVQELRAIYLKSIKNPEYDPILQHKAIDQTVYEKMKSKAAIPAKPKEVEEEKSFIGGIRKDDLAHEQKKKKRRRIFWILFSVLLVAVSVFILLDYFGIIHLIWA
ncbi:MAG: glutamate-cysteine ligase family protein [Candidatus Heimdallarchaeota archaeon]